MFPSRFRSTLAALLLLAVTAVQAALLPRLKISENQRYLVTETGEPFFYLADTAWELIHRLTRDEAATYLENRWRKGFNVIQTVVLAEFAGLRTPDAAGHLPLLENDPTRPSEAYFQHVDWVLQKANGMGLYVALLPTWGDKVNQKWGEGPEIFTPENARIFGEYLGRRYRSAALIWVLGGDRPLETERHRLIYRAMAEGLRAGDGGTHLITFHPNGRHSSSQFVQAEPWLDFHMFQSGHASRNFASYTMAAKDYALTPVRPTLDGEPNYEDHPVRSEKSPAGSWFDAWDVRKSSYWSVFAGGAGITYGTHPIWQFWNGRDKPFADPRHTWQDALHFHGSTQVGYLKRLLLSPPYLTRIPAQELLPSPGEGGAHLQATRDAAGTYAFIYTPDGQPFSANLAPLPAQELRAYWWDPRTGYAGEPFTVAHTGAAQQFTPPRTGDSFDWVLVVEDPAQNYPRPGEAK